MRFVAASQGLAVLEQRGGLDGWSTHALGAAVLRTAPDTPFLVQPHATLAIVGELFAGSERQHALAPEDAQQIVASRGQSLVRDYWGRYVAFWQDPTSRHLCVARDPSGAVPTLRCCHDRGWLLASDLATLAGAGATFTLDPDGLAHCLWYPGLPTRRTALAGLTELLPGEAIELGPQPTLSQLWRPPAPVQPGDDAATQLRGVILTTVAALSRGRPLLLELSGGLDSSILAAALTAAGADWRAINLVTPQRDGDERAYAALIADLYGADLVTHAIAVETVALLAPPRLRSARPTGTGMLDALDRAIAQEAEREGGRVLVSGTGGDNVFCSLRSAAPVLDAGLDRPFGGVAATLRAVARVTQAPLPTVALSAMRYRLRQRRRPRRWRTDGSLLRPDSRPALEHHPWLDGIAVERAGTRAHVAAVLRGQEVVGGVARAQQRRMLFPLLAQPVLETCLAVPSWRWVEGGIDRALAREAFRVDLPEAIVRRRTKGRLSSLLAPAYDRDRVVLGRLLRDGVLAGLGIVDRSQVERAIGAESSSDGRLYTRLLDLVDAELWARSATSGQSR